MFLDEYNSTAEEVWNAYTEASWSYNTNITEANKEEMVRPSDKHLAVFPGGPLSATHLPCLVLFIQSQLQYN